jgi:excinuclease UvrABC ATPase subunit
MPIILMASKPKLYKKIEGLDLIDKVINIDQSPIGRTPRSNSATYTEVFTEIRKLFANDFREHDSGAIRQDVSVLT